MSDAVTGYNEEKKVMFMKLSADILHNELAKQYRITRSGPGDSGLSLLRPEFYMEGDDTF